MKALCVFCGSSHGSDLAYAAAAREMGRTIASQGMELVYGGGDVGLMGVVADAALEAGGRVAGIIPEALVAREVAHRGLTRLLVVRTMHERKAKMAELSDGFVALPGGFGTIEEFCEVLTWSQLGLHRKPCGLLNVKGYFDPLLALFQRAEEERFLRPEHAQIVLVEGAAPVLIERMKNWIAPSLPKWMDASDT